ncbi:globin domain-containing protein [Nocardioides jensenii]|uniref:globin domain-containing protein n=1 Tax=Nocardioides jensenii TaxID=1843 RepID=UPI00082FB682|nr:globin domain-containing protein [Nocardioides jensenii]
MVCVGAVAVLGVAFVVWNLAASGTALCAPHSLLQGHAEYGARPVDHDTAGAALLATLATGLGATFTDEVRAAWTQCHGIVASTMLADQAAVA